MDTPMLADKKKILDSSSLYGHCVSSRGLTKMEWLIGTNIETQENSVLLTRLDDFDINFCLLLYSFYFIFYSNDFILY